MFEYTVEVLEYDIQCAEENIVSGLWRLNEKSLKIYKANISELQSAIEVLKKVGEK